MISGRGASMRGFVLAGLAALCLAPWTVYAAPAPDWADVSYGPHANHVFDLWRPDSAPPHPLIVYIHGGGFTGGDKRSLPPAFIEAFLAEGLAVASINYRFVPEAPLPEPMHDAARAVQFLRAHAAAYGLDPARFGAYGGSAGGGIAMWLATHDDLALPDSPDRVARASTRLACAASMGGQSSYDPWQMTAWCGEAMMDHRNLLHAYGLSSLEQVINPPPELQARFRESSPIHHVTPDDPPMLLLYRLGQADTPQAAVHSIEFGRRMRDALRANGVEAELVAAEADAPNVVRREALAAFFARHLAP